MTRARLWRLGVLGPMKGLVALAVLTLTVAIPATRARADFSQDFEVDTSGWFPLGTDTVNQEMDGYLSPDYASGVNSASPTHHARLRRPDQCAVDNTGSIGPSVLCNGPFTRWGGYNSIWNPYTTQVDVYLDVAYALANPDSIAGNIGCLTADSSDTACKGTRFDYSSAINDSAGNFLQDYAFDVGTGDPSKPTPCAPPGGFVVTASTNLFRSGTNIYDPGNDPFCIASSGWYTFKHTFMDVGGSLQVLMEIFPLGNGTPLHQWTITPGHLITDVGCNRYGWFANQEIWDLAIDNSIMVGCGTPATTTTTTLEPTTTSSTSTTTTLEAEPTTTTTLLDHFQCYEVKPATFPPTTVTETDQFGTQTETLRYPHRLCAPAEKNGEAIHDDVQHLVGYETLRTPFTRVRGVSITNQFGTTIIDLTRRDHLMVPSSKSLTGSPPLLTPPTIDHFQCYRLKRSSGTPRFVKIDATVADQLESIPLTLLKPYKLCVPTNKNGEDPSAPTHPGLLLCYKAKSAVRFGTMEAHVNNQFGPDDLTLIHRRELCVPSQKTP